MGSTEVIRGPFLSPSLFALIHGMCVPSDESKRTKIKSDPHLVMMVLLSVVRSACTLHNVVFTVPCHESANTNSPFPSDYHLLWVLLTRFVQYSCYNRPMTSSTGLPTIHQFLVH